MSQSFFFGSVRQPVASFFLRSCLETPKKTSTGGAETRRSEEAQEGNEEIIPSSELRVSASPVQSCFCRCRLGVSRQLLRGCLETGEGPIADYFSAGVFSPASKAFARAGSV